MLVARALLLMPTTPSYNVCTYRYMCMSRSPPCHRSSSLFLDLRTWRCCGEPKGDGAAEGLNFDSLAGIVVFSGGGWSVEGSKWTALVRQMHRCHRCVSSRYIVFV